MGLVLTLKMPNMTMKQYTIYMCCIKDTCTYNTKNYILGIEVMLTCNMYAVCTDKRKGINK